MRQKIFASQFCKRLRVVRHHSFVFTGGQNHNLNFIHSRYKSTFFGTKREVMVEFRQTKNSTMKRTTTLVFCMVLFVSVGNSFAVEAVSGDSTRIPKPPIKTREDWYEDTNMLCQYEEKKHGESISYKVLGKTRYRIFRYMSYNELLGAGEGELKKVLKWIVIHHPQFRVTKAKGDPVEEMRLIRNRQIIDSSYVFSDMASHFGIAIDAKKFEGVPLTHMGRHAGKTTQSEDMKKKNLPLGMMMSPDFGAIGIVLAGNFDLDEPTEAQVESLVWLLSL